MDHLLSWITFFPLIGVAAVLAIPGHLKNPIRWVAVAATGVPLALALVLVANFDGHGRKIQFVEIAEWIPSIHAQYHMGVDGLSVLMVLLTALLSFLCVFASWNVEKFTKGYFAMFLLLHVGMVGVFTSLDFFLFYVFWEMVLLPMYFLIGVWGGERKEYAAIKFFLYTLFGSVLMLIAMLALYFYSRGPDGAPMPTFNLLRLADQDWSHYTLQIFGHALPFDKTIWWLLFLGFAIKVPIFPFHTWVPWAHVQAPTPVSMILAGVLLKMGTYGLLRMNFAILPQASHAFAHLLAILGIVNILYGALCAMGQRDLKKLVAYSSISHMGYVLLGMAVLTPAGIAGAVLQMFNHGVTAAMLFLLVGVIYDRLHHFDILTPDGRPGLGGLALRAPWLTGLWLFAVFASLGLPTLNGFISEALVLIGAFPVYKVAAILAAFGIILTAGYFLWMVQRVFLGPFTALTKTAGGFKAAEGISEVGLREVGIWLPLAALSLWVGLFPQPFLDLIRGSLNQLIEVVDR